MQSLKNILDGKKKETLNYNEIRNAVKEYYSINNQPIVRSKYLLYFMESIRRNFLNPDLLLSTSILEFRVPEDLVLVALSLRFKANNNLYLMTEGIGMSHIIIYTVCVLRTHVDMNYINIIIYILLIMGSNLNSNAFDQKQKIETNYDTSFLKKFNNYDDNIIPYKKNMSVKNWLESQGMGTFEDYYDVLIKRSDQAKIDISILCDKPNIFPGLFQETESFEYKTRNRVTHPKKISFDNIIASRANNILALYEPKKDSNSRYDKGENIGLVKCIDSFYLDGFIHLIKNGIIATYFTINRILIKLKLTFKDKDSVLIFELQNMLRYLVSNGYTLDIEQLTLISTTSPEIANLILKDYNKPKWSKLCADPNVGEVNETLKLVGYSLNISSMVDKPSICEKLKEYSMADQKALKEAVISRQQNRVTADVSNISDFISGNVEPVVCRNKTVKQTDPFEYGDASLSYYKDEENHVWCFLSNMYESLIKEPVNPHTGKKLPEVYQMQIKTHLGILEKLGISPSNPVPIHTAIDNLHKNDEINSRESENILNTIVQASEVSGITSRKIKELTPEQMNQILSVIGMEQYSITFKDNGKYILNKEHQLITFARAAYDMIRENPDNSKMFMNNLMLV